MMMVYVLFELIFLTILVLTVRQVILKGKPYTEKVVYILVSAVFAYIVFALMPKLMMDLHEKGTAPVVVEEKDKL